MALRRAAASSLVKMPNMPPSKSPGTRKIAARAAEIRSQLNLGDHLTPAETCKEARTVLLMQPAPPGLPLHANIREVEDHTVPEAETPVSPSVHLSTEDYQHAEIQSVFPQDGAATDRAGGGGRGGRGGGGGYGGDAGGGGDLVRAPSESAGTVRHLTHGGVDGGDGGHGGHFKTYTIAVYTADLDDADKKHWWHLPEVNIHNRGDRDEWKKKYDRVKSSPFNTKHLGDSPEEHSHRKMYDLTNPLNREGHPAPGPESEEEWSSLTEDQRSDIKYGLGIREYEHTDPHPHGKVYVQLRGEKVLKADSGSRTVTRSGIQELKNSDSRAFKDAFKRGKPDEFAVSCTDLGDLVAVEFYVGPLPPGLRREGDVDPHDDEHSWNERRWKVKSVAVTYVQEDEDGTGLRSKKGQHAKKTGVTGNNVQWHFVPPAGERQWVGRLPPVPDLLEIEREPVHSGGLRSDGDWAHNCCAHPKFGSKFCGQS